MLIISFKKLHNKFSQFVLKIKMFQIFENYMNFQNKFEKITRMRVNAPFTRIRVNLLEYQLKYLNMSLNTLNFTTDIAGQINFTTGKSRSLQANQLRYRQISTTFTRIETHLLNLKKQFCLNVILKIASTQNYFCPHWSAFA